MTPHTKDCIFHSDSRECPVCQAIFIVAKPYVESPGSRLNRDLRNLNVYAVEMMATGRWGELYALRIIQNAIDGERIASC